MHFLIKKVCIQKLRPLLYAGFSMSNSRSTRFSKLPAKSLFWIMPLILSGLMSGALACINMLMNIGFVDGFFSKWLVAWSFSWLFAYPLILVLLPLVRRLLMLIIEDPLQPPKQ